MEPRDKHGTRNKSGRLNKKAIGKGSASSPLYLPNIEELIEQGQITVGVLRPVWSIAATAHDGHNSLAMLIRRKGETLAELLTRLDLAIAKAQTEGIFTDEINTPSINSKIDNILRGPVHEPYHPYSFAIRPEGLRMTLTKLRD